MQKKALAQEQKNFFMSSLHLLLRVEDMPHIVLKSYQLQLTVLFTLDIQLNVIECLLSRRHIVHRFTLYVRLKEVKIIEGGY